LPDPLIHDAQPVIGNTVLEQNVREDHHIVADFLFCVSSAISDAPPIGGILRVSPLHQQVEGALQTRFPRVAKH
jgi:hypothetical protein